MGNKGREWLGHPRGSRSSFIYTFVVAPEVRNIRTLNLQPPANTGSDGSFRYHQPFMASLDSLSTSGYPDCDKHNMEILVSRNQYEVHDCWLAGNKRRTCPFSPSQPQSLSLKRKSLSRLPRIIVGSDIAIQTKGGRSSVREQLTECEKTLP